LARCSGRRDVSSADIEVRGPVRIGDRSVAGAGCDRPESSVVPVLVAEVQAGHPEAGEYDVQSGISRPGMQLPLRNNTLDALLPLPQEEQPGRAAGIYPSGSVPRPARRSARTGQRACAARPRRRGDETAASGGDLQGMVPGRILHREGRSSLELLGVVARNLPVAGDPFAPEPVIRPPAQPREPAPFRCGRSMPGPPGQGETLKLQFRETRKQEHR
jgi:hypothetical protein